MRFYRIGLITFRPLKVHCGLALLSVALLCVALLRPTIGFAQLVLPVVNDVAARVADAATREQALFRLATVARFLSVEADQLNEDMEWISRLAARHERITLRSPVLDPAAWLIHLELKKRQLESSKLVSPLGPGLEVFLTQVFDRTEERLASVIMPELLWQIEADSTTIWSRFVTRLDADEGLKSSVMEAHAQWFADWAGSGRKLKTVRPSDLISEISASLDVMVSNATAPAPPDPERLANIRFQLLSAMPSLQQDEQYEAIFFLRMSGLVDGLHERKFFSVAEGLLAAAGSMLNQAGSGAGRESMALGWLSKNIPLISAYYAKSFSLVDPRLNSAIAASFDIVESLSRAGFSEPDELGLQAELADASAQLALMIPDMGFYFNLPVRDLIAGGMDACTGIMATREDDGSPAMTRELFDDCQQSLVDLADHEARVAALSGDPNGPFGKDELDRELSVTSGQRINYAIGYLHDRYSTGCEAPGRPLPNSIEWSTLATLLAWFAGQSPVYFQTPENEARLERMREIGKELLSVIAEQVDCFAGAGAVINDPITRSLVDYRDALVALSSGINAAIFDYRAKSLSAGADVALEQDSSQPTAYRPDKLMITPCDSARVCEMTDSLSSTRALWGLFPDEFLIADQTGLGSVEICYEEMAWVDRRSEQVRADDTNVANYFGRLSFNLKGRYRQSDSVSEVFGFQFKSPNEHHYLFAAATAEVLADDCPVEWIGQRIVTTLKIDHGVVPNRLTYLAASRMLPSRLLANNWQRGAEWRDWFITGIGVKKLEDIIASDISSGVNQQLSNLYRAEQAAVFQSILHPASHSKSMGIESLYQEMKQLTTAKLLIHQQFILFYPQLLSESDALRSAVAGHGGLLDDAMLVRFRSDNVPVSSLNRIAFERLEMVQEEWEKQPDAVRRMGTIAGGLAHAMMRLNALYQEFFAESAAEIIPVLDDPGD